MTKVKQTKIEKSGVVQVNSMTDFVSLDYQRNFNLCRINFDTYK